MLKSRGRTKEVSVMEMEEWPQVIAIKIVLFNHNQDFEYDQKAHIISGMKGVMPDAKGETNKNPYGLCR